jgi:hypothetical protein
MSVRWMPPEQPVRGTGLCGLGGAEVSEMKCCICAPQSERVSKNPDNTTGPLPDTNLLDRKNCRDVSCIADNLRVQDNGRDMTDGGCPIWEVQGAESFNKLAMSTVEAVGDNEQDPASAAGEQEDQIAT